MKEHLNSLVPLHNKSQKSIIFKWTMIRACDPIVYFSPGLY